MFENKRKQRGCGESGHCTVSGLCLDYNCTGCWPSLPYHWQQVS